MNRNKGIITLIVFFILLAGLGYVAVRGVGEDRSGSAASIKQGLDLAGGVSITYQVVGDEEPDSADMNDTIYKLQQRVEGYSTEAQVYQEGTDRINIEIPGVSDANAVLEELGRPGSLSFQDSAGNTVLDGTDIADAQAGYQTDSMGNQTPVVQLTMTDEGTQKFAEATEAAAPTHDIIYIIYDGAVVSAPAVNDPITDGQAVITGMASFEEAQNLASTIRIGGLSLELEELRSNVVGAQLGSEAIEKSLLAGAIGMGIVMLFMIAVYWVPGLASALALCMYVELIVLLLYGFDITLTLPGVAGIILSVGMAVDANVIIFARIREEIATGKTVKTAMKIGFQKALSAIIDGNVTTLIAAAVLGFIGSGTVRGFAQTLALGIVVSMFTALFVTRALMNAFYGIGIRNEKFYGRMKEKKTISFVSKKAVFFTASIAVILAGFVFMGINQVRSGQALNYSLEFVGGTSTNVTFNEDMSIEELDAQVVPLLEKITGDGNVQTQKVQGTTQVIFKTRTLSAEEREEVNQTLEENFGVDSTLTTAESISSTISGEMRREAFIAVIVAAVAMLLYVWFRFKDVRFGASAVAALVHDALVGVALYAVGRVCVGSTFIACMLTIVGYSINATIVIFDRIRENLKAEGTDNLPGLVDRSITQTLSRSIFTSLTTFIMVAVLYVLGVSSIREFALPLMIGIACGTYSSVCITGALWLVLKKIGGKENGQEAAKLSKKAKA